MMFLFNLGDIFWQNICYVQIKSGLLSSDPGETLLQENEMAIEIHFLLKN